MCFCNEKTLQEAEEWFSSLLRKTRRGGWRRHVDPADQRELLCLCRTFCWSVADRSVALLEAGAKFSSLIDELVRGRVSGRVWPSLLPAWEQEKARLEEKARLKELLYGATRYGHPYLVSQIGDVRARA